MPLIKQINESGQKAISSLIPNVEIPSLTWSRTRSEFEGQYTLVVFPLTRFFGKKPEEVAHLIGEAMVTESSIIEGFNVVKGFLNLELSKNIWNDVLVDIVSNEEFGTHPSTGKTIAVEFSSPNTNKPLHLGHIRNILLGWSVSKILEATGNKVIKTQIVNDRGIAVCKSMLAWVKYGKGETPESTGIKGDFFVGNYYILFEKKFQEEYKLWQESSEGSATYDENKKEDEKAEHFYKRYKNDYFNNYSLIGSEAREMLKKWEADDEETVSLWKKMNNWVYGGFEVTYDTFKVNFDKNYYESGTYLKGKEIVLEGLEKKVFYTEEDSSIWANLEDIGMDRKIILRSDGTALYITQDLGTAQERYEDYGIDQAVYVVGDEQDYHFQVLFAILKKLGRPFADNLHHLSYGMVDLPSGRMKSREGTVVDADVLADEVIQLARSGASERGELEGLSDEEKEFIYQAVGLGALKFFILKVTPKKRMTFNPENSLDMQGQTGPYIQNAFVRIQSILRKKGEMDGDYSPYVVSDLERDLLMEMLEFPNVVQEAADKLEPSHVANYVYNLAKDYHRFYHEHRILTAESSEAGAFRIALSEAIGRILEKGMNLLGIEMPSRM